MRQYILNPTVLLCILIIGFATIGVATAERPAYPAAPPVTQSDGYGVVPYAPHTPTMVTRPSSWPQGGLRTPSGVTTPQRYPVTTGTSPAINYNPGASSPIPYGPATNYATNPPAQHGPATNYTTNPIANPENQYGVARRTDIPFNEKVEIKPVQSARLLARVGSEIILAGDVTAMLANQVLEKAKEPIPEDQKEEILKHFLPHVIETKIVYLDVVRSIPEEALANFKTQVEKNFEENEDIGLPALMKRAKVKTREELEEKLRMLGSSVEAQKRYFTERVIAQEWIRMENKLSEPIKHEQMLDYYHEHATDFDKDARARWEQLTVRFSRHQDKQEAYRLIAQAGNQIMQGAPFAEVAKHVSEASSAQEGGKRDWTHKGSLASEEIDKALFALPPGQLSRIIEDSTGYHIIRVTQREEAHRTPFLEVQEEIKNKLETERFKERVGDYLARIKGETMIWTAYDHEKDPKENIATKPESETRR